MESTTWAVVHYFFNWPTSKESWLNEQVAAAGRSSTHWTNIEQTMQNLSL